MKRVMVVGQTGAGKTSLLKALGVWEGHVRKTEALAYGPQCIDTPGEFFDIPMFYHVLIQTSIKAAVILFLMDPLRPRHVVPNFSKTLRAPVIGVVSKADAATPKAIESAIQGLQASGVTEIHVVSSETGEGLERLSQRIRELRGEELTAAEAG